MNELGINYYFLSLTSSTDKMYNKFEEHVKEILVSEKRKEVKISKLELKNLS